MKETKKYSFEIRQLDCWMYDGEWMENTSYLMGEMTTKAQDIKRAFTAWIKRHLGISFKNNRTLIEYDGDCYTIIDRKTKAFVHRNFELLTTSREHRTHQHHQRRM